jgi:7-dehydrocholesterol reductase
MKTRRNSTRKVESGADSIRVLSSSTTTTSDIWGGESFSGSLERYLRLSLGPLLLLVLTPLFVNIAALTAKYHDSSVSNLLTFYRLDISSLASLQNHTTYPLSIVFERIVTLLVDAFPLPTFFVIKLVFGFVIFQLLLFILLPGKTFNGAIAPSGFIPRFKQHGHLAFLISLFMFGICVYNDLIKANIIYKELLPIMTLLNVTALVLAALLFIKGVYSPSTRDHGSPVDTPFLFRIFWGEELYPNFLGIDLKHFIICRCGMMSWFFFTLSFALSSKNGLHPTPTMVASSTLSLLYVAKFFLYFEVPGYMSAADIAVDRFGFMLAWGTLAFMPLAHSLQVLHIVQGSSVLEMSWPIAICWILFGMIMIWLNLDADTQRHYVRAAIKDGNKVTIWGKPVEVIRAPYIDSAGKKHENLLLVCGYHSLVRHFHYLPDIVLLFLYCAPSGFSHPLTFTYFFYLTGLLIDRCQRIDARCAAKYGKKWDEYVTRVPYKLIPGVF